MRAGQLRHRAQLYRRTSTQDQYSESVPTWVQYGLAWVSVTEQSADEGEQAGRVVMVTTALIKSRWRSDIRPEDRLIIGDDTWEISSVIDTDMRHKELVMRCSKTQTP